MLRIKYVTSILLVYFCLTHYARPTLSLGRLRDSILILISSPAHGLLSQFALPPSNHLPLLLYIRRASIYPCDEN